MAVAEDWTPETGERIAREHGIELTDRHRAVVDVMRRIYHETGQSPSIRPLSKASGVPVKDLYQLFPKGPAKLAAQIAGVPKPRGCI